MSIVKRISCPDCGGVGFVSSFDAVNHIRFENCERCGGTGLIESPCTVVDIMQLFCSIRTDNEYICDGCFAEHACAALRSAYRVERPGDNNKLRPDDYRG